MTLEDRIIGLIAILEEARADAAKCDKGKTGAPGTRLRKTATKVSQGLKELRAEVLEARK